MGWLFWTQCICAMIGAGLCWRAMRKPMTKPDVEVDVAEGAVEADVLAEVGMGLME